MIAILVLAIAGLLLWLAVTGRLQGFWDAMKAPGK